jgi:integrase
MLVKVTGIPTNNSESQKTKLLDHLRDAIRVRHYSQHPPQLAGEKWIMANLLHGTGLRRMACLRLRVKDIDFSYRQVIVRDGEGEKDRINMLPAFVMKPLKDHRIEVQALHRKDLSEGFGRVYLPHALDREYPNANREWIWQYVFPSLKPSADPRSGVDQRHHLDETVLQRAVREAARKAGLPKKQAVTCVGVHSPLIFLKPVMMNHTGAAWP